MQSRRSPLELRHLRGAVGQLEAIAVGESDLEKSRKNDWRRLGSGSSFVA
jgi:hypothetical protein